MVLSNIMLLIGGDHPARPCRYVDIGTSGHLILSNPPLIPASQPANTGRGLVRALVTLAIIAIYFLSVWLGLDKPAQSQAILVTPAPWLSIGGPTPFCYTYPGLGGCTMAEDKTGDIYVKGFKHDVDRRLANCLHWGMVGADLPAAILTMDSLCSGGWPLTGGIYWFTDGYHNPPAGPTATVTPLPSLSATPAIGSTLTPTPTRTPTPFPTSGTGSPTASPTVSRTPSPTRVAPTPGGTVQRIPTLTWVQEHAFSVTCDSSGRPYTMIIFGDYGLTYVVPDEWCVQSRNGTKEFIQHMNESTPEKVIVFPKN